MDLLHSSRADAFADSREPAPAARCRCCERVLPPGDEDELTCLACDCSGCDPMGNSPCRREEAAS